MVTDSSSATPASAGLGSISPINPLETAGWDEQVAALPGATFFHSAAWARVLRETYGYQPLYLAHREAGRIQSLLPLVEVDSWLTGRRGVSLPFTDAAEPLCPDASSFQALYATALALAKERKWKYLECRGGRKWLPDAPASLSYFSHLLELQSDEAALFKGFEKGTRGAVRKGERSGITVEFSQSLEAMKTFYLMHAHTRKRHGVPPQPFSFFANIQRYVLAKNKGWIVQARQGKIPVAGAVFCHFGRDVIYKFGASAEAYQQLRANNMVMWQAIQWYAQQGFASLDFGRTSLDNDGLRRFKHSWGTRESRLDYLTYDCRKSRYTPGQAKSPSWHTRIFNRLPVSLSQIIGSVLYRHVG